MTRIIKVLAHAFINIFLFDRPQKRWVVEKKNIFYLDFYTVHCCVLCPYVKSYIEAVSFLLSYLSRS